VTDQTSPYDPAVSLRAQERVYGRPANTARAEDPQHFLYPLPSLVVLAPFGWMPFPLAQATWMTLVELSLFASTLLWIYCVQWKPSFWVAAATIAFSVLWFPAFAAVVGAQFAAVEALLLAGALAAIRSQRDAIGGILLGASLIKPQLGIGLILYIAVWAMAARRRSLLGWLVTGVVAAVGASLILDPGWPGGMARQVIDYLSLPVSQSSLARAADSLGLGSFGTLALSGACLLYIVWEWKSSLSGDEHRFVWTAGMTQAVLLLVTPFSIAANLVTLMLPFAVILEAWYARQGRSVDAPATVLLMAIALFSWGVSIRTLDGGLPSLWLTLGVPLLTIVGLFWVRWWTMRARVWSELEGRLT
jgi:hypothetical protein